MEALKPGAFLRRHWLDAALVIAVSSLGLGHALWFGHPAFVDDAYISLANARALLHGQNPGYPESSPLTGATCAPHVFLLASLSLVFEGEWACWIAGLLGALAFALGSARLALALRVTEPTAAALVLAALFIGNTPYQLLNGLETSLAMAGVVWTLALCSRDTAHDDRGTALLCGTLPALRPELVVLSALILFHIGLRSVRRPSPSPRHALLVLGVCALLGSAPWLAAYWAYTGSPVPATMAAKKAFFAESCSTTAWKLTTFGATFSRLLREWGPWLAASSLLAFAPLGRLLLAFCAAFLAVYYVEFPGALGHYELRYLYVFVPFLLYGLGVGLARTSPRRMRQLSGALLIACVGYSALRLPASLELIQDVTSFTRNELYPLGRTLNQHAPPGTKLLVHDAGFLNYATDLPSADLVGLKTPGSMHWHQEITLPTCGRARAEAVHRIALDSGAELFVVLRKWDRIFGLTSALARHGWSIEPIQRRAQGYDVYQIHRPRPTLQAER